MDHLLHRPLPFRPARVLAGLLSGCIAAAMSTSAQAQGDLATLRTPVFVWGFQEGCQLKPDTTAQVMDHLAKDHGYRVEPLLSVSGQALPVCPGSFATSGLGCSAALQQECAAGAGLVLGGVVDHRDKATRVRLWLYDLKTKQLAVQDDYCQQCDPDDSKVVASHAAALLRAPAFGASATAQPGYCQSAPGSLPAPSAGPLHLGVFGSSSARDEIRRELLRRIGLKRGTQQPAPTLTEQRGTDPASFERITGSQDGAQVLRIEVGGSSAELYLWDQHSRRVATRSVRCGSSCRDALELIAQAAAEILDVCFADRCSLVQPAELRPSDACADLSKQECPALPQYQATAAGRHSTEYDRAQRIEILTGVGLGLSAAVAGGMWIANTVPFKGTVDIGGTVTPITVDHPLQEAAIAVTGLTGALVGLSIPIFYYLEKAKRLPPAATDTTKVSAPAGFIKCPLSSDGAAAGLLRRSRL